MLYICTVVLNYVAHIEGQKLPALHMTDMSFKANKRTAYKKDKVQTLYLYFLCNTSQCGNIS